MGETKIPADATRAEFRRAMLARRAALTPDARRERSRRIRARVEGLPGFADYPLLCCYVGFRDEVETAELILALLAAGRRVVVPTHLHRTGRPLVFARIDSWSDLEPGHFGVLQPPAERLRAVPTGEIPLFLVPGVAFDPAGNRLGFGLGFYDRSLADAAPGAIKVGLAFEEQVVDRLDAAPHDIPMDLVITEDRTITPPRGGSPPRRHCP